MHLSSQTWFTDGIRCTLGIDVYTKHQLFVDQQLDICQVLMAEAAMPEAVIKWESGGNIGRIIGGDRWYALSGSSKECSIVVIDGGNKQLLVVSQEVHVILINVDMESPLLCQEQHSQEIVAKLGYMQHPCEFHRSARLVFNHWIKHHSPNTCRIDNGVICQLDWNTEWLIVLQPMSVWGHVRCCPCVCIPIMTIGVI